MFAEHNWRNFFLIKASECYCADRCGTTSCCCCWRCWWGSRLHKVWFGLLSISSSSLFCALHGCFIYWMEWNAWVVDWKILFGSLSRSLAFYFHFSIVEKFFSCLDFLFYFCMLWIDVTRRLEGGRWVKIEFWALILVSTFWE